MNVTKVTIDVPDAYQRVGRIELQRRVALTSLVSAGTDPLALIVSLPAALAADDQGTWVAADPAAPPNANGSPVAVARDGFLQVRVLAGDKEFGRTRTALADVLKSSNRPLPQPDWFRKNECWAAVVPRAGPVTFAVEVNTDHEDYRTLAKRHEAAGRFSVIGEIRGLADTTGKGTIEIVFENCRQPPAYDGCLAIDLGNMQTAVALLDAGDTSIDRIRLLNADDTPGRVFQPPQKPLPVPSALRIDSVKVHCDTTKFEDHHFSWADWAIGTASATADKLGGLVFGPKRLAANPAPQGAHRIWVRDRPQPGPVVPVELPAGRYAELYACRLFQRFREAMLRQPGRFLMTYPTTYSGEELERLSDAMYRGWLRAMGKPQTPANVQGRDGMLRSLDEATAAAFFFVYRRVFDSPGGLPWFTYEYRDGLNLLLYDCGAGTTDIALVKVRPGGAPGRLLTVEVCARSGLRDFGGDNVTEKVFQLLKVKVAQALPGGAGLKALPTRPGDLAAYLAANGDSIDAVVPTRFDPRHNDDNSDRRRLHTHRLWQWAEQVKQGLNKNTEAALKVALQDPLVKFLADGPSPAQAHAALDGAVKVSRREVDELIRDQVNRGVRSCNRLIRDKLTRHGEEVDWVIAVGNGSLYPLISEQFKAHLHVHHFQDRYQSFDSDPENLKFAVAKGAVLALMSEVTADGTEFPRDLHKRLPFDIAYNDRATSSYRELYKEHTLYADMVGRVEYIPAVAVEANRGDGRACDLVLYRHWPGDINPDEPEGDGSDRFTTYLKYTFPNGVSAPITVRYDPDRKAMPFVVASGTDEAVLRTEPDPMYLSPVQRGTL